MTTAKVKQKYQITLPDAIRKRAKIQVGDTFLVDEKDGVIMLRPAMVKVIEKSQAWFWSDEWQKGIQGSAKAVKRGDMRVFRNVREAKKHFGD